MQIERISCERTKRAEMLIIHRLNSCCDFTIISYNHVTDVDGKNVIWTFILSNYSDNRHLSTLFSFKWMMKINTLSHSQVIFTS